jgi:hypothetical protein
MWSLRKLYSHIHFFYSIAGRVESVYALMARERHDRIMQAELAADPRTLTAYGYTAYSQADEDGIIGEIFSRIGTTDRRFIEFGCGDGIENNSTYMLLTGWTGLWMDGGEENIRAVTEAFADYISDRRLAVNRVFITRENIDSLITSAGFSGEIDFLSIDIDGNDYWIWEALTAVRPRVVAIEYNATFRPPHKLVQEYNPSHVWNSDNAYGASLSAIEELGARLGYVLVGCCYAGTNAFFVRKDLEGGKFSAPFSAAHHYREPMYDAYVRGFSRHRRAVGKYRVL